MGIAAHPMNPPDLTSDLAARRDPVVPGARFARSNGLELCYETFGDASHPAVLLVMGLGTQMIAWDEQFCLRIARHGYFVIRFDNRDIGQSTWLDHLPTPNPMILLTKAAIGFRPKVPYTLNDMARDAIGLLDALGIPKAHVVGASMGGMIGQLMAIEHADRMLTFTSIMSTTGDQKLPAAKPEAMRVLMAPPARDEEQFVVAFHRLMNVLRAGPFPEDEALDAMRARQAWARGYHPRGSTRQLAAVIASGNRTKALAAVRVPTLVIHGRADPLVPIEGGIATAEAIPGARLVVVERMGHVLPIALWDQIVNAIVEHVGGSP
jgi:pimeloyl-ACP methyl ester carboxylesterase